MRIDNPTFQPGGLNTAPTASSVLGSGGTKNSTTFLRGDNIWSTVSTGIPTWTVAGQVSSYISATTTAPTLATTPDRSQYLYRYTGPKEMQINMVYDGNTTGANNGNGDYLFTLPNSAQFDTGILTQRAYTNSVNANDNNFPRYAIPGGSSWFYWNNSATNWQMQPVVYDATRFRIMIFSYGTAVRCWSSGWYGVSAGQTSVALNFSIQVV